MFNSCIELNNLPDEILMIIFQKLNNIDVLYSFHDVNQRLNKIIHDRIFTSHLTFVKWSLDNFIDLFSSDIMLNRFCLQILPSIHDKIQRIDLDLSSIKHVLRVANYPNLDSLGLYNLDEESTQCLFNDKTLSSIFKNQITTLFITIYNNNDDDNHKRMTRSVANVCDKIFTVFTCLTTFVLYESSYKNLVRLNFDNPFFPNIRSSTLLKLIINVHSFDDCLYLLDGRFDQLHTLRVDLANSWCPDEIINQGNLPNLKCFSLSCELATYHYNEAILPLLYRMSNLEELGLSLTVYVKDRFIDGNHLKTKIIKQMPRLNQFTFFIRSFINIYNEMSFPSTEDIQQTFIDFPFNKISYVNYFADGKQSQCYIYSYPFQMRYYTCITNNFPDELFEHVRVVSLFDEQPFEHEFFLRIQKSFPFIEELALINRKPQNRKQSYESNSNNQTLPLIEFFFLKNLFISDAHDDYIEQYLSHTKTYFQNNIIVYVDYESLQRVTHNFTRDSTRTNCAKISQLHLWGQVKRSNSLEEYFPYAKICYQL
ncbi:unnamed protein product [Rotaria sp. Silwood2]|nr:unnamed protein product [Rotaria sp. Silwood2]